MVPLDNTRRYVWKLPFVFTSIFHFTLGEPDILCFYETTDDFIKVSHEEFSTIVGTKYLNTSLPSTMYTYGYSGRLDGNVKFIMQSFLNQKKGNVCLVDWPFGANTGLSPILEPFGVRTIGINYPAAAFAAMNNGEKMGRATYNLSLAGLNSDTVEFIGHSLGAHLWGKAAKQFKTLTSGKKVGRLTALDPASVFYEGTMPIFEPVGKDDADLVVVIHTDSEKYGNKENSGHIDFWPNYDYYKKNKVQPGCPQNSAFLSSESFCSHRLAWQIIVNATVDPYSFKASESNSIDDWMNGIQGPEITYIGDKVDPTYTGTFYLCTNPTPPYGKGDDGLIPSLCFK